MCKSYNPALYYILNTLLLHIYERKSKTILFNFTRNYQFSTRLAIEGQVLEIVQKTKLLGTIVSNDLKWNKSTELIVKKANKRMELLRKI